MPISQTERYFENPYYRFLEEHMLFLLALKWKLQEKGFSNVKTKFNSSFAVKVTERRNHSFLLSIWWISFFRLSTIIELNELNWLRKHMKNFRSSQPIISMNFLMNLVRHKFFHASIIKVACVVRIKLFFYRLILL